VELVRRSFGPLHLGSLKAGAVRDLTSAEVGTLLTLSREATARGVAPDGTAATGAGETGATGPDADGGTE
jgi:23S rRNA pseudouridine2605 synthase/16S rRNA pseudouridine516 synthase